MVISKTTKIMQTGIKKFAAEFNVSVEETQIQVTMLETGEIVYKKVNNWLPISQVTFLEIMDKKYDFLGFEMMASPVMQQSIVLFAEQLKVSPLEINVFIFEHEKQIGIAVYHLQEHKKNILLKNHLENLGYA